ncbi:hypothetical protein DY000_02001972 [Brassica cretica]|uniref:Uncharacterized protein n=1 Tax=Brassica cretica TaxID=69181 RepID=A0ABQ7BY23_BRACR|nr:hypothetical protein DY000_02001972 [Brassica cretica]
MMTMRSVFVVLSQPPGQPAEEENEEGDEDKDNDGDVCLEAYASTFAILNSFVTVDLTVVPVIGNSDELGLCLWMLPNDLNEPAKTNFEFMFADYDILIDLEYLNYVPVQTKI